MLLDGVARVAGHEENVERGEAGTELICQLATAHSGHHDIGEEDVDGCMDLFEESEGLATATGPLLALVASEDDRSGAGRADAVFRPDDVDALVAHLDRALLPSVLRRSPRRGSAGARPGARSS